MIEAHDKAAIAVADNKEYKHATLDQLRAHSRTILAVRRDTPIAANCNTAYHAIHDSGTRPLDQIWNIVIHATEGGTSQSVASYFTMPSAGGSTQLVTDDYECYRCLRDDEIPWGAPGMNYHGFHIEQCGYAAWLSTMWSSTHRKTLMRTAYKTALHCKKYDIPITFCFAADLKAGKQGITTHAECTKAFGGDHTDPGAGWPRALFMGMVRSYAIAMKVKIVA